MKKSITKNYIYNLLYQIIVLILPLITTPYISRVLGARNIGIYSYTISITTYFILFGSLGIAMYGQREIAYIQDDAKKYSKTFWEITLLRFITVGISMIIFWFTFASNGQYNIYYKILLLELLANCMDISWFFQGLEEFKKTILRNIIIKIISVMCIFTFVKTTNDLSIYLWIYVLSTLIGNLSLWPYLTKYLRKVKIKEINVIKHIKPTIELFIPQIAIQIYTVLDKVMIGSIIIDKAEVGYYEQSQKVIKMLLTIVTSLGTVMVPRMANAYVNSNKKQLKEYMQRSFNFVFLLAFPMILGIISISKNFVPLFFGTGYDKVVVLMNIISPILLAIGLSNVIGTQYLLQTKKQKKFTISVVIGAVTNFTINILLIKRYGAIGASIGTVIAEAFVTIIQFWFIREDFNIKEIIKLTEKYLISSVIMFISCIFIGRIINDNLNSIIVQISIGMIIYIGCLIIMKDKFTLSIIVKLKEKMMRGEYKK